MIQFVLYKILVTVCLLANLETAFSAAIYSNNANWMSQLPYHLTTIPLNYLAIPGSHDSFSYTINSNSPVSPDSSNFLQRFGGLPLAKSIVAKFSVTQRETFAQQLQRGIRYFDLRVCYREEIPQDPFWFCHGLYAMSVLSSLVAVKDFLNVHPKEIVFLDFQHFYGFKSDNEKRRLAGLLQNLFGRDKTVPYSYNLRELSLRSLWQNQHQVMIFFKDIYAPEHHVWNLRSYVDSPWANTAKDSGLISFLEQNYKEGRSAFKFYVHQGVMTIDAGSAFLNLIQGLKSFVVSGSKKFVEWIKTKELANLAHHPPVGINICIMDFVEEYDFVNVVLSLNYK